MARLPYWAPTKNGGVGEGNQTNEQHQRAEYGNLLEGRGSKAGARGNGAVRDGGGKFGVGEQRGHEHETREQADNDGVPERTGHGNERLASGVLRGGGRRNQRSRAHARFVGENAAFETELQSERDRGTNRAASGAGRGEGANDNLANRLTKELAVYANDDDAARHVENSHDGNEFSHTREIDLMPPRMTIATSATTTMPTSHCGMAAPSMSDVLYSASASEFDWVEAPMPNAGQRREQREQHSQHATELLVLEAALERVHRAAEHLARVVFHAILHADKHLGILGGDAQDAGDPHPENGARAAEQKARAHTDDVARADGGSQRCRKRAELGDVAIGVGRVVLSDRQLDASAKLALDEPGANRHEDVRAQQKQNHDGTPHEAVDGVDNVKRLGGGGRLRQTQ